MRYLILFLVIASACTDAISVNVQDGIERFEVYRNLLTGKRVGIVANHTSRVDTVHSVDFLLEKGIGEGHTVSVGGFPSLSEKTERGKLSFGSVTVGV